MNNSAVSLYIFYGMFLIGCGICSVIFIGPKAKTAVMSGGISGLVALFIAWLTMNRNVAAPYAGLFLAAALFCVFAWRASKTLFRIFEIIPKADPELKGKGIAFLIISLMAVVSIVVFALQVLII